MTQQARNIVEALGRVETLRAAEHLSPALQQAVAGIRKFQSRRFQCTYADLASDAAMGPATQFFLSELYGEKDFAERDAQFQKVSGPLVRLLPGHATDTVVRLARLHALSVELDHAMAHTLLAQHPHTGAGALTVSDYILAWRQLDRQDDRQAQLDMVLALGRDLVRLTRTQGLRFMLKAMHGPANVAGFGALQHFLETGFDTFARMNTRDDKAAFFLACVAEREAGWIRALFRADPASCQAELSRLMDAPA